MTPFLLYIARTSLVSQFVEEDRINLQELKDLIATIENKKK